MRVRLDQPRHECAARAVDHGDARRAVAPAVRRLSTAVMPVGVDEDFAGERLAAGAVEDLHVGDDVAGHVVLRGPWSPDAMRLDVAT